MFNKIFVTIFFVFFTLLSNFVYAMIAAVDLDEESRLRIRGRFFVQAQPPQGPLSEVLVCTITDEDLGTLDSPGPLTLQRANPDFMMFYSGGPHPLDTTLRSTKKQWMERLADHSPATAYVLKTPGGEFIGHAVLDQRTPSELMFSVFINPGFQRNHFATGALMFFAHLFPMLRTNPLTAPKTRPLRSIVTIMNAEHPARHAVSRAFYCFGPYIRHVILGPTWEEIRRHLVQELRDHLAILPYQIEPNLQRTEFRWTIMIPQ